MHEPPSEIEPCDYGVVFALGVESGGLEDALAGSMRIRGHGLTIRVGGLKGRRAAIVRSGPGGEKAARAAEILLDGHRPRMLLSAGFAGGLSPELKRHDILLADRAIDASGREILLHQTNPANLLGSSDEAGGNERPPQRTGEWPGLHTGTLLSADRVVRLPAEKRALFERHGALAVDMETFAAAEVCRRRGVPFAAVRIIYDAFDDTLPPDVERLLDQKSEAARWRGPGHAVAAARQHQRPLVAQGKFPYMHGPVGRVHCALDRVE